MMRSKLAYKTAAWLTIALFASLAVLSFSGQVLCVGEDNHIQLELTGDYCCDLEASDSGANRSGAARFRGDVSEESGCGDCSDVDLDNHRSLRVFLRSTDVLNVDVSAGPVWSVTATPSINCMGIQVRWDEHLPGLTQAQLSISTAILIC